MSWSFNCIGKPKAIAAALDEYGSSLDKYSKIEFGDSLDHLKALVLQNYAQDTPEDSDLQPLLHFQANGHGSFTDYTPVSRNCSVNIARFHVKLV